MSDIILNGVSINELKKQADLVRKDAVAFISTEQKKVEELAAKLSEVMEDYDDEGDVPEEAIEIAEELIPILENIKLVSDVSGVEYYINCSSDWGDEENVITTILQDFYYDESVLGKLYNVAEEMESSVRHWNMSYC